MCSGDLSSQLASGQRPEPRQFIPREVVRGRRVMKQDKSLVKCILGFWSIAHRTLCLVLIRTIELRLLRAFVGVSTSFYGFMEALAHHGIHRCPACTTL